MNLKEFTEKYGNKEVEEAKLKELLGIKDSKVWRPKHLEEYWSLVYRENKWLVDGCENRNQEITDRQFDFGLVFKTVEQAKEEADKRNFLQQMELDFKKNSGDIDWGNRKEKYAMAYDREDNFVEVIFWYTRQHGNLHTTNREWLEQYIRDNEENIKKYYFGVGE